jgi:hypothetical protein
MTTAIQKDLLFGSLLGDGNLQTETDGRTWRYRALQKTEHLEYLMRKYEILKPFCSSPPIEGQVFDERTGKIYYRHYFNTRTDDVFRYYGNMFYAYDRKLRKWVKRVPPKPILQKLLTPGALAFWYMDDGAIKWLHHSNAMRICTESFPKDDVTRLRNVLFEKYEIVTTQFKKTRVDKKTGERVYVGDRIAIPEESSAVFCELIKPYLVDCMKYKVSDGNKGHL